MGAERFLTTVFKIDDKQFSSKLSGIEKTVIGFNVSAAAAAASALALAQSTANYQDQATKAARSAGVTSEEFSKLAVAAEHSGVSQEEFSKSLVKLNNMTPQVSQALARMGIALTDVNGNTKDAKTLLYDVSDAMGGMASPAQKSAAAFSLFGEEGVKLASMLGSGSEALEAYAIEAEKTGKVVTESAGVAAEKYNDDLTTLQNSLGGLSNTVGESVISLVNQSDIFLATAGYVQDLVGWVNSLDSETKTYIAAAIAAATAMISIGGAIVAAKIALTALIPAIQATVASFNPLLALAAVPIVISVVIAKNEMDANNATLAQFRGEIDKLSDSQRKYLSDYVKGLESSAKASTLGEAAHKNYADAISRSTDEAEMHRKITGLSDSANIKLYGNTKNLALMQQVLTEKLQASASQAKLNNAISTAGVASASSQAEAIKNLSIKIEEAKIANQKAIDIAKMKGNAEEGDIVRTEKLVAGLQKYDDLLINNTKQLLTSKDALDSLTDSLDDHISKLNESSKSLEGVDWDSTIASLNSAISETTTIISSVSQAVGQYADYMEKKLTDKLSKVKEYTNFALEYLTGLADESLAAQEEAAQAELDAQVALEDEKLKKIQDAINAEIKANQKAEADLLKTQVAAEKESLKSAIKVEDEKLKAFKKSEADKLKVFKDQEEQLLSALEQAEKKKLDVIEMARLEALLLNDTAYQNEKSAEDAYYQSVIDSERARFEEKMALLDESNLTEEEKRVTRAAMEASWLEYKEILEQEHQDRLAGIADNAAIRNEETEAAHEAQIQAQQVASDAIIEAESAASDARIEAQAAASDSAVTAQEAAHDAAVAAQQAASDARVEALQKASDARVEAQNRAFNDKLLAAQTSHDAAVAAAQSKADQAKEKREKDKENKEKLAKKYQLWMEYQTELAVFNQSKNAKYLTTMATGISSAAQIFATVSAIAPPFSIPLAAALSGSTLAITAAAANTARNMPPPVPVALALNTGGSIREDLLGGPSAGDVVPAMLTPGETVLDRATTRNIDKFVKESTSGKSIQVVFQAGAIQNSGSMDSRAMDQLSERITTRVLREAGIG